MELGSELKAIKTDEWTRLESEKLLENQIWNGLS